MGLNNSREKRTLLVSIKHLHTHQLPIALSLKKKVDKKQRLNEFDLGFLKEMISNIKTTLPLYDHNREYQHLGAKVMNLYDCIISKALENETTETTNQR